MRQMYSMMQGNYYNQPTYTPGMRTGLRALFPGIFRGKNRTPIVENLGSWYKQKGSPYNLETGEAYTGDWINPQLTAIDVKDRNLFGDRIRYEFLTEESPLAKPSDFSSTLKENRKQSRKEARQERKEARQERRDESLQTRAPFFTPPGWKGTRRPNRFEQEEFDVYSNDYNLPSSEKEFTVNIPEGAPTLDSPSISEDVYTPNTQPMIQNPAVEDITSDYTSVLDPNYQMGDYDVPSMPLRSIETQIKPQINKDLQQSPYDGFVFPVGDLPIRPSGYDYSQYASNALVEEMQNRINAVNQQLDYDAQMPYQRFITRGLNDADRSMSLETMLDLMGESSDPTAFENKQREIASSINSGTSQSPRMSRRQQRLNEANRYLTDMKKSGKFAGSNWLEDAAKDYAERIATGKAAGTTKNQTMNDPNWMPDPNNPAYFIPRRKYGGLYKANVGMEMPPIAPEDFDFAVSDQELPLVTPEQDMLDLEGKTYGEIYGTENNINPLPLKRIEQGVFNLSPLDNVEKTKVGIDTKEKKTKRIDLRAALDRATPLIYAGINLAENWLNPEDTNYLTADNVYGSDTKPKKRGTFNFQTGETSGRDFSAIGGAYGKYGGALDYREGQDTYMSEKDIREFLANGGEIEFI